PPSPFRGKGVGGWGFALGVSSPWSVLTPVYQIIFLNLKKKTRLGLTLQILIHPAGNVLQASHPPVSPPTAGQAMRLTREQHQFAVHPQLTQSHIQLLALLLIAAEIILAVNNQRGRF